MEQPLVPSTPTPTASISNPSLGAVAASTAGYKRLACVVVSRQVPADDVVGDWEKASVATFRALDPRFLTHATDPFIRARGGVTRFAGLSALEASRIDVFSATEEGPEDGDLVVGR
jgi:hypothetical protein